MMSHRNKEKRRHQCLHARDIAIGNTESAYDIMALYSGACRRLKGAPTG